MRRGARSIRGALGTYLWVSSAAVVALALVLWLGPDGAPETTRVVLAPGWEGATLDVDGRTWELRAGAELELPPGTYRVTLFAPDGEPERRELELSGELVVVGE